MKVRLKQENSGLIKEVPVGFSWTTLLFGVFVPLIRGDLKWFIIFFIASCLTGGLAWIVVPFVYNKIHIKDLLQKEFVAADEYSANILKQKGFIV